MYGVDFLVEHTITDTGSSFDVKLLEINAEPAIELTGPRLEWILRDLFSSIGKICVEPFFNKENNPEIKDWAVGETKFGLRKCLEIQVRGEGRHG
jgi:tubulin---tyrosine ligase